MKAESFGPPEPEQPLMHIGISAQDIHMIRTDTKAVRSARREYPSRPDFSGESGNYQVKLRADSHIASPYTSIIREIRTWPFSRQPTVKEEVREIQPIPDIAQQIADYAKAVAERSDSSVQIVDFGAGAATTMRQAAQILDKEITTGKVNILATNIDAAPPQEQPIQFATADILELYTLLQGSPIHLLFMIDTFPFTNEYNDHVLKIAGEMLHPEYGTAILGYGTLKSRNISPLMTRPHLSSLSVIERGLDLLRHKGFTDSNPIKKGPEVLSVQQPAQDFPFDVYQGSNAPPFYLYTV